MTYETFLSLILNRTQNLAGKDVSVSVQKTVKNNGVFLDQSVDTKSQFLHRSSHLPGSLL